MVQNLEDYCNMIHIVIDLIFKLENVQLVYAVTTLIIMVSVHLLMIYAKHGILMMENVQHVTKDINLKKEYVQLFLMIFQYTKTHLFKIIIAKHKIVIVDVLHVLIIMFSIVEIV
jgi:hypothetical protein